MYYYYYYYYHPHHSMAQSVQPSDAFVDLGLDTARWLYKSTYYYYYYYC